MWLCIPPTLVPSHCGQHVSSGYREREGSRFILLCHIMNASLLIRGVQDLTILFALVAISKNTRFSPVCYGKFWIEKDCNTESGPTVGSGHCVVWAYGEVRAEARAVPVACGPWSCAYHLCTMSPWSLELSPVRCGVGGRELFVSWSLRDIHEQEQMQCGNENHYQCGNANVTKMPNLNEHKRFFAEFN